MLPRPLGGWPVSLDTNHEGAHFSRVLRKVGHCSSTTLVQSIVVPTFRKERERWGTLFIADTKTKAGMQPPYDCVHGRLCRKQRDIAHSIPEKPPSSGMAQ